MTDDPKLSPNVRVGAGPARVTVTVPGSFAAVREAVMAAAPETVSPADAKGIAAYRECERYNMSLQWEQMGESWMVTVTDAAGEAHQGIGDGPIRALVVMARNLFPPGTVFPGESPG